MKTLLLCLHIYQNSLMEGCVCFSVTILRPRNKASLPPKEKKKEKKEKPLLFKKPISQSYGR